MRLFITKKKNMNKHTNAAILSVLTALLLFGLYIVLMQHKKTVYDFKMLPPDKYLDSVERGRY